MMVVVERASVKSTRIFSFVHSTKWASITMIKLRLEIASTCLSGKAQVY